MTIFRLKSNIKVKLYKIIKKSNKMIVLKIILTPFFISYDITHIQTKITKIIKLLNEKSLEKYLIYNN